MLARTHGNGDPADHRATAAVRLTVARGWLQFCEYNGMTEALGGPTKVTAGNLSDRRQKSFVRQQKQEVCQKKMFTDVGRNFVM